MTSDIFTIFYWWLMTVFLAGLSLPLTFKIFDKFWDKGWIFAKTASFLIISYLAFIFGRIRVLPFYRETLFLIIIVLAAANIYWLNQGKNKQKIIKIFKDNWQTFAWQEGMFLIMLTFWSLIRGFDPAIEGLEKFMDQGFVNAILRSKWFPPQDMWFAGQPINYYYFGHLIAAVLTKISGLASAITYNLMMATIFAQAFTGTFSIASNLIHSIIVKPTKKLTKQITRKIVIGGLISAMLLTLGGNLHTITYVIKDGADQYWYPDATRFIGYNPPNPKDACIHEFPMYSFVVSDLHGHVNDIPVVLLFLAVLLSFGLVLKEGYKGSDSRQQSLTSPAFGGRVGFWILPLGFLLAVMFKTSSWEFPIYGLVFGVFIFLILISQLKKLDRQKIIQVIKETFLYGIVILLLSVVFVLPFALSFDPMTEGIRFVDANSLWWQLLILWGFFWFVTLSFWIFLFYKNKERDSSLAESRRVSAWLKMKTSDMFVLAITICASILIIIPEIIYVKDIYIHEHHRSNTMFKLVYQSFIMYSIAAGYIFIRIKEGLKNKLLVTAFLLLFTAGFVSHMIYPYFSIKGYYGDLKNYQGIYGMNFLEERYPDNYEAVLWMNKNIDGQPVILEAVGESYTIYNHFSAMTGLPTIQGWTVHQWLWRGSYDPVGRRVQEVETIYQGGEIEAEQLLKKYQVEYVIIGPLEMEKYPELDRDRFSKWGRPVFTSGETIIYQMTNI